MRSGIFILLFLLSNHGWANDFDVMVTSYENGNYELAFPGFVKLKGQGDARSLFYLGQMYEFGRGTQKDTKKAFFYYEKAAKLGYANAQIALGWMYAWGKGVKTNPDMALFWLNEARILGSQEAQEDYQLLYRRYRNKQLRVGKLRSYNALVAEMKKARKSKDL